MKIVLTTVIITTIFRLMLIKNLFPANGLDLHQHYQENNLAFKCGNKIFNNVLVRYY